MLINLSQSALALASPDGTAIVQRLAASDTPAVMATDVPSLGTVDGVAIVGTHQTAVLNLPAPVEGTLYIVDQPIAQALRPPRLDVVFAANWLQVNGEDAFGLLAAYLD